MIHVELPADGSAANATDKISKGCKRFANTTTAAELGDDSRPHGYGHSHNGGLRKYLVGCSDEAHATFNRLAAQANDCRRYVPVPEFPWSSTPSEEVHGWLCFVFQLAERSIQPGLSAKRYQTLNDDVRASGAYLPERSWYELELSDTFQASV